MEPWLKYTINLSPHPTSNATPLHFSKLNYKLQISHEKLHQKILTDNYRKNDPKLKLSGKIRIIFSVYKQEIIRAS